MSWIWRVERMKKMTQRKQIKTKSWSKNNNKIISKMKNMSNKKKKKNLVLCWKKVKKKSKN